MTISRPVQTSTSSTSFPTLSENQAHFSAIWTTSLPSNTLTSLKINTERVGDSSLLQSFFHFCRQTGLSLCEWLAGVPLIGSVFAWIAPPRKQVPPSPAPISLSSNLNMTDQERLKRIETIFKGKGSPPSEAELKQSLAWMKEMKSEIHKVGAFRYVFEAENVTPSMMLQFYEQIPTPARMIFMSILGERVWKLLETRETNASTGPTQFNLWEMAKLAAQSTYSNVMQTSERRAGTVPKPGDVFLQ